VWYKFKSTAAVTARDRRNFFIVFFARCMIFIGKKSSMKEHLFFANIVLCKEHFSENFAAPTNYAIFI
jgi:hypothetical protein